MREHTESPLAPPFPPLLCAPPRTSAPAAGGPRVFPRPALTVFVRRRHRTRRTVRRKAGRRVKAIFPHSIRLTEQPPYVQITVRGPFRQWQPATNTTDNDKQGASCSDDKPAGSSSSSIITSTTMPPEPHKDATRADIPHPHPERSSRSRAKQHKPGGPADARSPLKRACGFCRSFLGPNTACLHPSRQHRVMRRGDRLLVRARDPSAACYPAKSAPARTQRKTCENQ